MKKLAVLLAIVIAMSAMCVSAFAVDTSNLYIQPQVWVQDTPNYASWVPLKDASGNEAKIALGETVTVVYTGDAWRTMTTAEGGSYQYGIQILDCTIDQSTGVVGDATTIKYEISDIVITATGYETYTAPVAGTYTGECLVYVPSWGGIAGNTHVPGALDFTAAAGGSDGAALTAYVNAIESVTFTITYLEYNGEGPAASEEAPAEDTTTEEAPAEDTTTEEAPATEETEPADTGLALAVVPMLVAAVAVVASKRR